MGLFGFVNQGQITNLHLEDLNISGGNNSQALGGLIGHNIDSSISNCYATGSVSGGDDLGGLAGHNDSSNIRNCYATCIISGANNLGGLVGIDYSSRGSFRKCFWDYTLNPTLIGIGNFEDPNVHGETTVLMQDPNTFISAGWDFVRDGQGTEDHWQLCLDGYDYPRLAWEFGGFGDFLEPGRVDTYDLMVLANDWLTTESRCGDICPSSEPDGIVNFFDYLEFAQYWLFETEP